MVRLDEIFDIWYGVNLEVVNCEIDETGIPFVSRQSVNNGVVCYVKPIIGLSPNPAFTLSIAASGSVLSTFFHEYEYYSGRDVYVAKPRVPLTKAEMLYYCAIIEQNKYRYNYGRAANRTLKNIMVPSYDEIPEKYRNEAIMIPFTKEGNKNYHMQPNRMWRWFRYDEIFDIKKGKRLTKADMINGNVNYIGASDSNNGITAKIGNIEQIHSGNKITVSYNGSIAEAFYQADSFWATDDVNVLTLKGVKLNVYLAMFLITLIRMEKYRFNYGRKWDKELMKQSKIKLPVTKSGNPDWQFMEDYIKSLPYSSNI